MGLDLFDFCRHWIIDFRISSYGIAHEFRTTLVPGLLTEEDMAAIRSMVPEGPLYRTQPFRAEYVLDSALLS